MATLWRYLPILKWKQGERIALRELASGQWNDLVPLLELPAVPAAPTAGELNAALPAYRDKLIKQLVDALPDDQPFAVDTRYVSPPYAGQVRLATVLAAALAKRTERPVIPVISESMVAAEASKLPAFADFPEVILRIRSRVVDATQTNALVDALVSAGIKKKNVHLLVDQDSIVNAEPAACDAAIQPYLDAALACGCASVTYAGGSFPINLIGYKQGIIKVRRVEWVVWTQLQKIAKYEVLRYGDYTVSNPAPVPELDPTQVNPSVAIRYAAAAEWQIFKAGGFKRGKPNQYRDLCQILMGDPVYSGPTFSFGDAHYNKVASGPAGVNNGNPSSWRRDATNHHLVLTATAL